MSARSSLLAGAMFAAAATAPAAAQDGREARVESAGESGDIIITARKREESLFDVPVAATAVTADMIERNNMQSIADIAALTPGLTINIDSPRRALLSIRGVGTTFQPTVQPGVGLFIDGIYQPNTSYLNNPALDVDRIEVLRGPQGTLYGKNTLGGAINVVTRRPGDQLRIRGVTSYTDGDNRFSVAGSISGPIVPGVVQARIAASHTDADGFWENRAIGGEVDPQTATAINATLRIAPSSGHEFLVNGYFLDNEGGEVYYSDVGGPRDYRDNVVLNQLNRADIRYAGANLTWRAALPALSSTLTTILAYDSRREDVTLDADFTPFDIVRRLTTTDLDTKTLELRLESDLTGSVSTLLGAYVSRQDFTARNDDTIVPLAARLSDVSLQEVRGYALFGTVFWSIAPDLELTAGLRYDREKREQTGFSFPTDTPGAVTPSIPSSLRESAVQPRFTLTRNWTGNFMTYASVARGYRGGGINGSSVPADIRVWRGDSAWTYEVGTRVRTRDNRFSLSAALFYSDVSDFIANNSLVLTTAGTAFTTLDLNTGDLRSYGLEAEFTYRPTSRWTIAGALTLMNARITDATPYFETTGRALPSDRVTFLPDWNYFLETSYRVPVGNGEFSFRGALTGKGSRLASTFDQIEPTILESYHLLDLSASYEIGQWEVSVFAQNVTGTRYFETYIDDSALQSLGLPGGNLGILGSPRRVGVRLKFTL